MAVELEPVPEEQIARPEDTDPMLASWRKRLKQAQDDRRKYEVSWELSQAFLAGKQWVGVDRTTRRVVELPNPQNRVRHTVNVITGLFWTQQGKLTADDVRPDVTFRREDFEGRQFAEAGKFFLDYLWDEELEAQRAYLLASVKRLTFGIGGLRCMFDPLYGRQRDRVPMGQDGSLQLSEETLQFMQENGTLPDGTLPKFKSVREGRVKWEAFGPFHMFPPPGVVDESEFPWFIIGRAVPLDLLPALYENARGLREEKVRLVDGGPAALASGGDQPTPQGRSEVKDHALLFTGYEFPCADYPDGRIMVWSQGRVLHQQDSLFYKVNDTPKAGLSFLKYHIVEGRWWPVGLVEPAMGPQRQRNVSRSQNIEIKDRLGLARIYAHDNAITEINHPEGLPAEVVSVRPGYEFPRETPGTGPGPWIAQEVAMNDGDIRQVVGLGDISLSQVPSGVSAYSAFALLVEQDEKRLGFIRKMDRLAIADLTRVSIEAVRTHWPPEKMLEVRGEEGFMEVVAFKTSQLPASMLVRVPETAPMPASQAAEAQLIFDIFDRAISSGQPLPLDWLYDSIRMGRMQPLPKREMRLQEQTADYENMLIVHGQQVQPNQWDNDELHVVRHRAAQQAYQIVAPAFPQYQFVVQALEEHVQAHLMNAQQKAMSMPPRPGITPAPPQGVGGQMAGMGPLSAQMAPVPSAEPATQGA